MSKTADQTPHEPPPAASLPEELLAEADKTFPSGSPQSGGESPVIEHSGASPSEPQAAPFAYHQHTYVTEYIKLADQKAAVVFAATTGLLSYLFTQDLHKLWLKNPMAWNLLDILCFLGMAGLAVGLLFAAAVIVPWLHRTHRGLVFFRSVNEFESATAYASEVLSSTEPLLTRAILKHTYDLSKACSTKYAQLSIAIWAGIVGVLLSVILLMFR